METLKFITALLLLVALCQAQPLTETKAVSSAQDQARSVNTTFSCYNRTIGYYADAETNCQVYHFCAPGDFNGEVAYQRISYLCLNETRFDQQVLDCVAEDKMSAPCAESEKHFDESNKILRQAVIRPNNTETTTSGNETSVDRKEVSEQSPSS